MAKLPARLWQEMTTADFAALDKERTIAVLRDEQDAGRSPASVSLASAGQIIVIGGERAIFDHVTDAGSDDDASFARELALTWWYGVYRRPAG